MAKPKGAAMGNVKKRRISRRRMEEYYDFLHPREDAGWKINSAIDRNRYIRALKSAVKSLEADAECYCYGEDEEYLRIVGILNEEIERQRKKREKERAIYERYAEGHKEGRKAKW